MQVLLHRVLGNGQEFWHAVPGFSVALGAVGAVGVCVEAVCWRSKLSTLKVVSALLVLALAFMIVNHLLFDTQMAILLFGGLRW